MRILSPTYFATLRFEVQTPNVSMLPLMPLVIATRQLEIEKSSWLKV